MTILNLGPLEVLVIFILMFLLLGPKEMILTARKIGLWVRGMVRSPMWKEIMGYSAEIRELPKKIMDDTGLQETLEEVRQSTRAASDELKNQLKEVNESVRVVEAEHLRIDPNALPDSPAENNTILPPAVQDAVAVEAAVEAPAVDEAQPAPDVAADAAVVEVAPVKKTRKRKSTGDEDQPAAPRARKKKGAASAPAETEAPVEIPPFGESAAFVKGEAPAEEEAVEEAVSESEVSYGQAAAVQVYEYPLVIDAPPDVDAAAVKLPAAVQLPAADNLPAADAKKNPRRKAATAEGEDRPAPRKPRKTANAAVVETSLPAVELPAAEVLPAADVQPAASASLADAEIEPLAAAPRVRKPRARKVAEQPANNGTDHLSTDPLSEEHQHSDAS